MISKTASLVFGRKNTLPFGHSSCCRCLERLFCAFERAVANTRQNWKQYSLSLDSLCIIKSSTIVLMTGGFFL